MKHENLDDYELFYMELPQADYLKDIEIQDEYDDSDIDSLQGLSDEQVSEIARDSLDEAHPERNDTDNNSLFSDNKES
jgi:chromatin remodeling complex protein RSC6